MRIDRHHYLARHVKPMLNGEFVQYAIAADTEAGTVERFVRANNEFVREGDDIRRETLHGVVTLIDTRTGQPLVESVR